MSGTPENRRDDPERSKGQIPRISAGFIDYLREQEKNKWCPEEDSKENNNGRILRLNGLGASKKAPTRAPNFSSLQKVRFPNLSIWGSFNDHNSLYVRVHKQHNRAEQRPNHEEAISFALDGRLIHHSGADIRPEPPTRLLGSRGLRTQDGSA